MPDEQELEVAPWPAWLRYGILSVIAVVVGIGLIIAFYRYGFLPVAGPFVVLLLVPLVFFLRALWIRRRLQRTSAAAVAAIRAASTVLDAERRGPSGQRSSLADDGSLDRAADQLESALKQLAWGREAAAAAVRVDLAQTAQAWQPEAELSVSTAAVVQALEQIAGTLGRADDLIRRRDAR